MIPLALSLALGAGIWLLYDGLTRPPSAVLDERPGPLVRFLRQAGIPEVGSRDFVLISLGGGALSAVFAQVLLGWPVVSALALGIGGVAPAAYYLTRRERRRRALQLALIEAIGQVRDGIRSGLSIEESLRGLIRHGPGVLRPEFAIFARELQLDGFAPALVAMRERLADPAFDLFAGSLLLSHHLGGHQVSQVLERLAFAARAQLKVQEELRAYQARTVLSARIVAALPLAILIVIRQVDPAYLAVFDDWIGQMVLAGCVVSVAIGYVAMLWIGRLPSEPRVF